MTRRIALVGGGAASAALVCELLERRPGDPLHVDWYTGEGELACGVAYGTTSPRHLLNVRAASMGLHANAAHGFLDFVQRDEPERAGTDFLPRRRYGQYLQVEVARVLDAAATLGHRVQILPGMVDAIRPDAPGFDVIHGLRSRRADAVVLAVGALPPRPLDAADAATLAGGRYIVDPWPFLADASAVTTEPREVVLIGSGLTAADVVLELAVRWPHARFTAVSRHGHWPQAHRRSVAAPASTGAGLATAMFAQPALAHWMHLVRETIRQGDDWRAVVDGLRPHTQALWQALPVAERARFLRHADWAFQRVRHRMPPEVADGIAALERAGRLALRHGRVRGVTTAADRRLEVAVAGPPATGAFVLPADLVIQATGLDLDVRRSPHPLLRQLLTDGAALPDPLGLGLAAEADGRLHHAGGTWENFLALGSLLRGTLWECTALPEIRQQARLIVDHLLAD